MMWTVLLMATLLAAVTATAVALAQRQDRLVVLALVGLGVLAAVVKILIVQALPQWHDINPDSITYGLNGQAFAAHWQGKSASLEDYRLRGLHQFHAAGQHPPVWAPQDHLSYASVIGSHEWLYPAYVGLFYWLGEARAGAVIASNALWAAFFPAAAFGIAVALGASRRVALASAGFALIDPNAGVNASWLLKDTLAGFLAMATAWALAAHLAEPQGRSVRRLAIAVAALGVLGGVRFVAFVGFVLSLTLVACALAARRHVRPAVTLAAVAGLAWLGQGILDRAPHWDRLWEVSYSIQHYAAGLFTTPARAMKQGLDILRAEKGEVAADATTLRWKDSLRTNAAFAVLRSVAHTLFAPYPWVAIYPGLTWRSFSELYYPGVLLWLLCLPGVVMAIANRLRTQEPAFWFLLLFLLSQLAAYTLWQGEWSTRQRVFALPIIFALAAIGWSQLAAFLRRRPVGGGSKRQESSAL